MTTPAPLSLAAMSAGRFNERADSSKFLITFDDGNYDLGYFSKASGLGVKWDLCDYRSGSHREIWQAPGIPKYTPISLTRAACRDSQRVQLWLTATQRDPKPFSGSIELLDWAGDSIIRWDLESFFPTAWKISDLDSMAANVVTETLEIAHTGFLADQLTHKPGASA